MTEREMIARMIRIGVEDNCSIYQAKENGRDRVVVAGF